MKFLGAEITILGSWVLRGHLISPSPPSYLPSRIKESARYAAELSTPLWYPPKVRSSHGVSTSRGSWVTACTIMSKLRCWCTLYYPRGTVMPSVPLRGISVWRVHTIPPIKITLRDWRSDPIPSTTSWRRSYSWKVHLKCVYPHREDKDT